MSVLPLAVVAVIAWVALAAALVALFSVNRLREDALRAQLADAREALEDGPPEDEPLPVVAVTTRLGTTITGRLRARDGLVLVVASAQKLDEPAAGSPPNAPPVSVPMDGDVVIPWANVDYWQQGLDAALLNREA